MTQTCSFDTDVGIVYDETQSVAKGKDLWYTDNAFTFIIGDMSAQKYVTVNKGFVTDGASVPRMLWAIIPPWGDYGQAAVLHDYLCQSMRLTKNGDNPDLKITQADVDGYFRDAMKVLDTPLWKRQVMYLAVRFYHRFISHAG